MTPPTSCRSDSACGMWNPQDMQQAGLVDGQRQHTDTWACTTTRCTSSCLTTQQDRMRDMQPPPQPMHIEYTGKDDAVCHPPGRHSMLWECHGMSHRAEEHGKMCHQAYMMVPLYLLGILWRRTRPGIGHVQPVDEREEWGERKRDDIPLTP